MQSYGMGKYLAGLWEKDLFLELLWIAKEDPAPDYDASDVSGSDHDLDSWFGVSNNGEESDDGNPEGDDSEEEKSEGDESEEKESEQKESEEKETEKGDGEEPDVEELTDEYSKVQILEASKSTNGDEKVRLSPFARPATYLAPKFSWASRVGPIKTFFTPRAYTIFVDFIEATCTPKGLDPLGQVSKGSIKVVGRITEAKFHPKACIDDLCEKLFEVEGGSHAHNTFSIAYAVNPECHLLKRGFFPQGFTVDSEEDARTPKEETVYCLLVVIEHEPYDESEEEESEGGGEEGDEEKNEDQDNDKNEDGEEAKDEDNNKEDEIEDDDADKDDKNDEDEDEDDDYDDIVDRGKAAVLILRRSPDGEECYTRIGASHDFPVAFFNDAVEKEITIL